MNDYIGICERRMEQQKSTGFNWLSLRESYMNFTRVQTLGEHGQATGAVECSLDYKRAYR
jgi:hypothetical protein